jgi:hypothetical protein
LTPPQKTRIFTHFHNLKNNSNHSFIHSIEKIIEKIIHSKKKSKKIKSKSKKRRTYSGKSKKIQKQKKIHSTKNQQLQMGGFYRKSYILQKFIENHRIHTHLHTNTHN